VNECLIIFLLRDAGFEGFEFLKHPPITNFPPLFSTFSFQLTKKNVGEFPHWREPNIKSPKGKIWIKSRFMNRAIIVKTHVTIACYKLVTKHVDPLMLPEYARNHQNPIWISIHRPIALDLDWRTGVVKIKKMGKEDEWFRQPWKTLKNYSINFQRNLIRKGLAEWQGVNIYVLKSNAVKVLGSLEIYPHLRLSISIWALSFHYYSRLI